MGVKKRIVKRQTEEIMVREAFSEFFAEKKILGRAEATLRNYKESLDRFLQILEVEDFRIRVLDEDDVLTFIETLEEIGAWVETINRYLRDLRAFVNWCNRRGYYREN